MAPRPKTAGRLFAQPLVIALALALLARIFVQIYAIPSESMVPTLLIGDHILVTRYLPGSHPQRGDVVVFSSPQHRDELVVKRVIAVPGDLIEGRDGRVVIGGHTIAEPYLAEQAKSGMIPAQIIPASACYVMGDNRARSLDSRVWGVLPNDLIVGKARLVLWSHHPSSHEEPALAASAANSHVPPAHSGLRLFTPIR